MHPKDYTIKTEPNWRLEVAQCLLTKDRALENAHIESSSRFGMDRKEMENYLSRITLFKDKVLHDIQPIRNEYEDINYLFEETEFEKERTPLVLAIIYAANSYLKASEDIKSYISEIINQTFMIILDEIIVDINQNNLIITDLSQVVELLQKVNLDDVLKMKLINLYSKKDTLLPKLWEFLNICTKSAKDNYYIIKEDFEKANRFANETNQLDFMVNKVKGIKLAEPKEYFIQTNIVYFQRISVLIIQNVHYIDFGIYYMELLSKNEAGEVKDSKIITDLKALGDGTRLKIIHLLAERSMYLQEIADEIHLTPATVSHHINVLLQTGIVCASVNVEKAKKVYYEIYTDKINAIGDSIKALVAPVRRI
jgi:DNA-binding transcriptional ArsR family regulator